MDNEFESWLAGFWEGEGSLYVGEHSCLISLPQTTRSPLDYIKSQLGFGNVYVRSKRIFKPTHNICYVFEVANISEVLKMIDNMLPHLKFRRGVVEEKREKIIKMRQSASHLKWVEEEDGTLKTLYPTHSASQIGKVLEKTPSSVRMRAFALGLTPVKGSVEANQRISLGLSLPKEKWKQILELRGKDMSIYEIAEQVKIAPSTVWRAIQPDYTRNKIGNMVRPPTT